MCSIAVIDDGIHENSLNIGPLNYNVEITTELEVRNRAGYNPNILSHGTMCAAIIRKYSPVAVISSIKILNDQSKGGKEQLIKALRFCVENGIKLINISLGTIDYRDFTAISKVVNEAYKKGLIIVAACSNKNIFTYPASHTHVIGVKSDKMHSLRECEYMYHEYTVDGIEITACGSHKITEYTDKNAFPGNSFAAPFITALVHKILEEFPTASLEEVKQILRKGSVNYSGKTHYMPLYKNTDWVDNGILFRLGANIKQNDYPELQLKTKKTVHVECDSLKKGHDSVVDYIKSRKRHLKNINTVIVDVVDKEINHKDTDSGVLIESVLQSGKNVVYLDDTEINKNLNLNNINLISKIWHPSLFQFLYQHNYQYCNQHIGGIQRQFDTPLIVVYDQTGKNHITAVHRLMNLFRNNGYYSIGVSDTCKGILCGLEYAPRIPWPNGNDMGMASLRLIRDVYSPDIIIIGTCHMETYKRLDTTGKASIIPSVEIIIAENFCQQVKNLLQFCNDSKKIVITAITPQMKSDEYKEVKFFDIQKKNFYRRVFEYILCSSKEILNQQ